MSSRPESSAQAARPEGAKASKPKKNKKRKGDELDYDGTRGKVAEDEKAFCTNAKRKVSLMSVPTSHCSRIMQ